MKMDRRTLSCSLSVKVIDYLVKQGHSQAHIAKMLGVSQAFISLVRSRERGLTLDHLDRLTMTLCVPLGAFMLAVTKPRKGAKYSKELFKSTEKLIKMCDAVTAAILRDTRVPSR
jgi:predicted transcriptional regulator